MPFAGRSRPTGDVHNMHAIRPYADLWGVLQASGAGGHPPVSVVSGDRVRKEWVLGTFSAFAQTGGHRSKRNTLQSIVALFQHFLRLLDVIRDNRQLEQVIGEADNVGCLKIHASLGELGCHRS
jgi:hypothetical protein